MLRDEIITVQHTAVLLGLIYQSNIEVIIEIILQQCSHVIHEYICQSPRILAVFDSVELNGEIIIWL